MAKGCFTLGMFISQLLPPRTMEIDTLHAHTHNHNDKAGPAP